MAPLDGKSAQSFSIGTHAHDAGTQRSGIVQMVQDINGVLHTDGPCPDPARALLRSVTESGGTPWWALASALTENAP